MKLQKMSPAADRVDFKVPPAPRLTGLEGKTIGLYNNMTGGSDIAVDRVAEHICRRFPDVKFERYGGDLRPGRPALRCGNHIDDDEAALIAAENAWQSCVDALGPTERFVRHHPPRHHRPAGRLHTQDGGRSDR